MIRWLLSFFWGLVLDELRAQLRPYLELWELLDEAMLEQERAWA